MTGLGSIGRSLAAVVLAVAMVAPSAAQAQPAAQAPAFAEAIVLTAPAKPENAFSRFEIVSLGSFPIMLFYSGFALDLAQFAANNFNSAYAPWPFKNEYSAKLSDSDRLTRIGVALSASILVGALDAYIHASKLKAAKRLRAASLEASSGPSPDRGN